MSKSTETAADLIAAWEHTRKPSDFPLGVHKPTAQFCKKIKGAVRYFGKLPDWRSAVGLYEREREAWERGENPRARAVAIMDAAGATLPVVMQPEQISLHALATLFIDRENKRRQRVNPTTGHPEIRDGSFVDCRQAINRAVQYFGKDRAALSILPDDWAEFRHALYTEFKLGPTHVQKTVVYVRALSAWAHETAKHLREGFHFGDSFGYVPRSELRHARRKVERANGEKVFPTPQIALILEQVKEHNQLYAMFLLSLNGAMNATECAELTIDMIDFDGMTIDFDRGKTSIRKFYFMWPETAAALKVAWRTRPMPASDAYDRLVFLTAKGNPWVRRSVKHDAAGMPRSENHADKINQEFCKHLLALDAKHPQGMGGCAFKRGKIGFGTGRHTARTALRGADEDARRWIIGHAHKEMDDHYLHIDEETKRAILLLNIQARERFLGIPARDASGNGSGKATGTILGPRLLAAPTETLDGEVVGEPSA